MATTRIDIEGNSSSLVAAVKAAEAALGRLQTTAQQSTRALDSVSRSADMMGRALQTALAVAVGGSLFSFVDGLQNLQNKLRVATNTQEEFNQGMAAIRAIADKTGQSLNAIGDLYSKVAMNATTLGYNTSQIITVTNAFATALQVSGASAQGSASAIYQFSQILAKGKVNGDEFTTIMENLGGPVMDLVAKNMGLTTAELIKLKEKGLIGAKDFTDALIRSMDQLAVMGGKVAPTIGQAFQRIQNAFGMFLMELERSTGVFDKLAKGMSALAKNIDAVVFAAGVMGALFVVGRFLVIAREVIVLAESMGVLAAALSIISRSPVMLVLSGIAAFAAYMSGKKLLGTATDDTALLAEHLARAKDNTAPMAGQLTGVADKYKEILKDVKEQLAISTYIGDEHKIQAQMLVYKKQLEGQITKEQSNQLENLLREIDYNQKVANIRKSIRDLNVPKVGIEAQVEVAPQLAQFDPMKAAMTQQQTYYAGLKSMRDQDLISEQQYQIMKMNAAVATQAAIMDATRKQYENAALLRIQQQTGTQFGYDTQKQMAAEAAAFEMKSQTEKTAMILDASAQMFTALGAQNKKAFEAAKAFNIANALMNAYLAFTKALATYPWPAGAIFGGIALATGLAQVNAIRAQQYSGRALGGPVMGGKPYMVGENGPELFTPATTGTITRNGDLGNQGGATNINFTIVANDAQGFDDLLIQRKGMIKQFISDAMAENGQRSRM